MILPVKPNGSLSTTSRKVMAIYIRSISYRPVDKAPAVWTIAKCDSCGPHRRAWGASNGAGASEDQYSLLEKIELRIS